MKKNKLWTVGTILGMVAIIAGGWVIGIAPQLSIAATAEANRISVERVNAANEVLLARLKKDSLSIDDLRSRRASLRVAVPASAQISTFVTELNTLANSHQITVKSISVSDAKPYAPLMPASPDSSNHAITTVTNPRITTANFVVIPVRFSVTGDYRQVLDFVHEVQTGPRLFLVSTLSSAGSTSSKIASDSPAQPDSNRPQLVDATIGGYMYVLLKVGK